MRERLDRETQRSSCVLYLLWSFSKPENDFTCCFSIPDMDDGILSIIALPSDMSLKVKTEESWLEEFVCEI